MRYLDPLKKGFVLIVAALCVAIVNTSPATADGVANNYLREISQYTNSILEFLREPDNIAGVGVSLMEKDTGENSINTVAQESLAQSGWTYNKGQALALELQKQLIADIIGMDISSFSGKDPSVLKKVPNVNDLSYASLLGQPPVENASSDPYTFLKYTSGVYYRLPFIKKWWKGDEEAKDKYRAYFNTITAIKSFGSYVLSQLTFDAALKMNATRAELVSMASSSSWIAQVATEELGRVFRQILLFESQNFVLNTQIDKNLRNMVSLQAMTNTLLINLNALNEKTLTDAAQGGSQGDEQAEDAL